MGTTDVGHPTVVVDDVHRRFYVPVRRQQPGTFAGKLRRSFRGQERMAVHALRGVSFVAHAGESIGIVGTNGSGKSTLLSIIAGLDQPTSGEVLASSQPILLGVGAALQQELSGIDNARLGLLAMGLTPAQVADAIPRVRELAGIGEAIHRPIRTYSSGMGSRLSFAIATASEPEILLLDEVLATGDAASVKRAEQRMNEVRARAGTVFLVSHAAQTIQETCSRAIWLHEGELIQDGPAESTAEAYRWWAWNVAMGESDTAAVLLTKARDGAGGVEESRHEVASLQPAIEDRAKAPR